MTNLSKLDVPKNWLTDTERFPPKPLDTAPEWEVKLWVAMCIGVEDGTVLFTPPNFVELTEKGKKARGFLKSH